METTKQKALLKHFSAVLRKKANDDSTYEPICPIILKFLSRKELIDIIKSMFDNSIPKDLELVELENEELLEIIGDELFIISHVTNNWVKAKMTEKSPAQKPNVPVTKKPKNDEKITPIPK